MVLLTVYFLKHRYIFFFEIEFSIGFFIEKFSIEKFTEFIGAKKNGTYHLNLPIILNRM